nr:glycosyltransferase family 4 protein [uncultured Acetatifactor sp.]
MGKVAFITNIPSPYRVDLFYYIQTMIKRHELHVIYTSEREGNRLWNIAEDKLLNSYILHSKVIELKGMIDKRFVHLPVNVGKKLHEVKPDVVIAMEYNPAALQALWWCRRNGKKFIHLTDGTLFSERNIGKIQKVTRKIITKNCDAAIASSTRAKEKLLAWGVPEEKIFVSLLTVDVQAYFIDR